MRLFRIFVCLVLVIVLVLAPVPIQIPLFSQAADVEEITGYQVWTGRHIVDKHVIVKPGATLVIDKGAEIIFSGQFLSFRVEGSLFVKGTEKERVRIECDASTSSFSISAEVGSHLTVQNADISDGGTLLYIIAEESLVRVAQAENYRGAIQVNGGVIDVQDVTFRQNPYAITVASSAAQVRVNRSRFIDNEFDVAAWPGDDFRYNWWGAPAGPTQTCYTYNGKPYCYYEKIEGSFDHSSPLPQESFRDPVLVIPGILGSYPVSFDGNESDAAWTIDPLFQTYRDLVGSLKQNGLDGYVYDFPYDWRESNVSSAILLKERIRQIKEERNWPVVDIVAHSMGGLVSRQYIESDGYQNDVDQLITLGTPHMGAPETYLRWDGAKWFPSITESIQKFIFKQWAEHEGFDDIFDYLHDRPVASVQELLPVYDYLFRWNGSEYFKSGYGDGYPKNTFLENLNAAGNIRKLNAVELTKIVGKIGDDESTIAGFNVITADKEKYWRHGFPDNIDSLLPTNAARGIIASDGDQTVPLFSALSESIPSAYTTILDGVSHNDLPTESQDEILDTLGISGPYEIVRMPKIKKMLAFFIYSPIDMQVVSPSGKRIGKNFETGAMYQEIPDAFYSGYQTKNEFVTIPNPEEGEYQILTQGTGTGPYRIEITHLSEDTQSETTESTVTIRGEAESGVEAEAQVEVAENTVALVGENHDTTPPVTSLSLSGTLGLNHWYTSDVVATFTATDDMSGIEKTEYSLNGGDWTVYVQSLTLSDEGTTEIKYRSTDKQGNQEPEKTEIIKIDKTAPEAKVFFNPTTQKLDISGIDALSVVSVVTLEKSDMTLSNKKIKPIKAWFSRWHKKHQRNLPDMLATLTDQAGHTTSLIFEKTKDKQGFAWVKLRSLSYDDGEAVMIQDTQAAYQWKVNRKGGYQIFASSIKAGENRLESHYLPKQNETWIMEHPEDLRNDDYEEDHGQRLARTRLPGMVVPYLETERGEVKAGY